MNKNVCPFCGSSQLLLHNPTVWNRPDIQVYRCEKCDLAYLYPMITEEEEKAFYANYDEHVKARLDDPQKLLDDALPEAERRLSHIHGLIHSKMRILEIGSATGAFLNLIKDDVREVLGVEPSMAHADYMTSLGISHVSDIDELNMKSREKFDCAAMFHVFEHIRDPLAYLKVLREKYLTEKGFLWIEVPNVEDALLTLYKCEQFEKYYYQPMHHYYYSAKTLSTISNAAGFNTVELIPVQRYDLSNHMYWLRYGKPGGAGKYSNIFPESLDAAYAESLKQHFLCDTILGIFQH